MLFAERVGAEVVECACVIELPDLKVCYIAKFSPPFNYQQQMDCSHSQRNNIVYSLGFH